MHRRLLRWVSLAALPVTLMGTGLLSAGTAQATSGEFTAAAAGTVLVHHASTATTAQAHPGTRDRATSGPDYKSVCGAPKPGEAACLALVRTNVKAHKGITPDAAPSGYGPSDLQSAYNLPSSTAGSGETVAIVDAGDDPTAETDLGVYRAQYGLAPCTTANGCFEKVNQEGQQSNYPVPAGWADEESLDVDMVSAACPNCHILLIEANSAEVTDLGAAVDEAVALGAKYVSNSYGAGDQPDELQWDAYYDHPGVAVTASAGDGGYGVEFPAASQYVTSVGGTSLTRDSGTARGWTETAWGSATGGQGTGSGCSAYEPKPSWQTDTGCANRTVADVSAVANPNTGVAVYDSQDGGWLVFGGTSVASPLIASVYALAGPPASNYPAAYPYANTAALNDVTSGADGTCTPAYLCTAGPGYDGPTGLGTPDGVTAFSAGAHGDVAGRVTNASTGAPVIDALVRAGRYQVTTGSGGSYDMELPPGRYKVTVSAYGYASLSVTGVKVTTNTSVTENFPLAALPTATLSGTVTDGSGHHWPLYAQITVNGVPGPPVYTSPYTGRYRLTLPQSATYSLQVIPVSPGYQNPTAKVTLGTASETANVAVHVDPNTCAAPGYAYNYRGLPVQGFDGNSTPSGWTVTDNIGTGNVWQHQNVGTGLANWVGGTGGYQYVGFALPVPGQPYPTADTSLVSPSINLTGIDDPVIGFDTDYEEVFNQGEAANVDVSTDGGQTWTTVWQQTTQYVPAGYTQVSIPQAANQPDVQVRFHAAGLKYGDTWLLDNVFVGTRSCDPARGGLVAGVVTDGNTRAPLNGVQVASAGAPGNFAVSTATAQDPDLPDGFYEMFSPLTGAQPFSATDSRYQTARKTVAVAAGAVTKAGFTMQAGHLTVQPSLAGTVRLGGSVTRKLTVTNTGKVAAHLTLGEQTGGLASLTGSALSRPGNPVRLTKGHFSPFLNLTRETTPRHLSVAAQQPLLQPGGAWTEMPSYEAFLADNVTAYDPGNGKVYSVGGAPTIESIATSEAYDPSTRAWTPVASMPAGVMGAAGGFIHGKLYVFGGLSGGGFSWNPENSLQIYDPARNTWTTGPGAPSYTEFAASATLDGQLYIVGGCSALLLNDLQCYQSARGNAFRFNPATGSWSTIANYPVAVSNLACGGLSGELVCTGGLDSRSNSTYKATYIYNPATNTWSKGASLPIPLWGMGYAAANGQLLVSDGVTANSTEATNQGFAYNPATNKWATLPNSSDDRFMGGSACGFFQVGGWTSGSADTGANGSMTSEELPGYDQCGQDGTKVPWLTARPAQLTIPAGGSATVAVTMDAGTARVTQPGTYAAGLILSTDTPYDSPPVTVKLNVTPPRTWGKITGTVSGTACGASTSPLAGATVEVDSRAGNYALTTGANGQYSLWLDQRSNPLTLIATDNGWRPRTAKVRVKAGQTTTTNFTLTPQQACS